MVQVVKRSISTLLVLGAFLLMVLNVFSIFAFSFFSDKYAAVADGKVVDGNNEKRTFFSF